MSSQDPPLPRASAGDGRYPRPQLVRPQWTDLSGEWHFAFDDDDRGIRERWHETPHLTSSITVPFPPESPASGVNDTGFHRVLWYHRVLTADDLTGAGYIDGQRLMLRFGAVDFRAIVWVNGQRVGSHEGGHTPFALDVTDALRPDGDNDLVVRVEDDPLDVAQPRGKQDWREHPHVIWYHRTSGIWQPVWLESVPKLAIEWIHWKPDLVTGRVSGRVGLTAATPETVTVDVQLRYRGELLARTTVHTADAEIDVVLSLVGQSNGQAYEELLWSPEKPRLIDAWIELDAGEAGSDVVASYLGLRSAAVDRRVFMLNDRPRYVRSVLNQGYWPQSHLAAPSADALRAEAQLIRDLGFNATRIHQKFEDPRFLFWADRLGLMVWSEAPATFTFTALSVKRTMQEWFEVVHRDFSHPSIVTWVPLNESWGVQHISHDARMLHFARALVHMTKALDPTRPVVSNDGWEQADTDILAIHDYEASGDIMRHRYRDRAAIDEMVGETGPSGRRLVLSGDISDKPVMLTEFGGIKFDPNRTDEAWGYSVASSPFDFDQRLRSLMDAVHDSIALAGFCYTQLTDTLQEANGLVDADRVPKLPIEQIRKIVLGPRPVRPWEREGVSAAPADAQLPVALS